MKIRNTFWDRLQARDRPETMEPTNPKSKREKREADAAWFDSRPAQQERQRRAFAGETVAKGPMARHRGKPAAELVRLYIAQGLAGNAPRLSDRAKADIAARRAIGEAKLQAALDAAKVQHDPIKESDRVSVRRKHGGTTQ